jgi:hypothetical protein
MLRTTTVHVPSQRCSEMNYRSNVGLIVQRLNLSGIGLSARGLGAAAAADGATGRPAPGNCYAGPAPGSAGIQSTPATRHHNWTNTGYFNNPCQHEPTAGPARTHNYIQTKVPPARIKSLRIAGLSSTYGHRGAQPTGYDQQPAGTSRRAHAGVTTRVWHQPGGSWETRTGQSIAPHLSRGTADKRTTDLASTAAQQDAYSIHSTKTQQLLTQAVAADTLASCSAPESEQSWRRL